MAQFKTMRDVWKFEEKKTSTIFKNSRIRKTHCFVNLNI